MPPRASTSAYLPGAGGRARDRKAFVVPTFSAMPRSVRPLYGRLGSQTIIDTHQKARQQNAGGDHIVRIVNSHHSSVNTRQCRGSCCEASKMPVIEFAIAPACVPCRDSVGLVLHVLWGGPTGPRLPILTNGPMHLLL